MSTQAVKAPVDWKQYISVAAFVFSLVSFSLAYALSTRSATTSVRPVLVFEYTQQEGWSIRNVGTGPALNVLVAGKDEGSDWRSPVRIPPLQRDGRFLLSWIGHPNIRTLGASYTDIEDRPYSSSCTDDLSKVYEGNRLKRWPESQVTAHWKLAPGQM